MKLKLKSAGLPLLFAAVMILFTGYFEILELNQPDSDPGNQLDYWIETLERIWDPGSDMKWVVYQTKRAYKTPEIAFVDLYFYFITGDTEGNFELDYLVSNAALDFSGPDLYAIPRDHPITVQN